MNPTSRFTERAADYSASRPSYGGDALDFILEGTSRPLRVADIGAGTGISARLLAARGCEVVAIEPNAAMRERADTALGVRYIDGTAEATTLAAGSIDLLTAFQAFHWFANDAALAECRRVIRPRGRAALVLNERDEREAFTSSYGSLIRRYAVDDTESRRIESIDIFKRLAGRIAEAEFTHVQTLDHEGLWRRTVSSSYMPHTGEAAQRLRRDVDALFDRWSNEARVGIALRTIVVRVDLTPTN